MLSLRPTGPHQQEDGDEGCHEETTLCRRPVLVANVKQELQETLEEWNGLFPRHGLKINLEKAEVLHISHQREELDIELEGNKLTHSNKGCKCAKTTGYMKNSKSNEGRKEKNGDRSADKLDRETGEGRQEKNGGVKGRDWSTEEIDRETC